ncbi:MAG: AIR synthase-related protein [Sulfolobales archaeon]
MSDLEGIVRIMLERGVERREIINKLCEEMLFYKRIPRSASEKIAEIILEEVLNSLKSCEGSSRDFFCSKESGVSAGLMGVGSRGFGDFFFHRLLAGFNSVSVEGSSGDLDDAGWFKSGDKWIITAVDGIHSRLAYFPLLAGFHAARAAARDVMVKGGVVRGFLLDLRISDDGDISYLLELEAGVAAVSRFLEAPILGGSTLRMGGDMVIGRRIVGTVFAVGESYRRPKSRKQIEPGHVLLMSEGSGGGTIATTAIFSGEYEIALKTINFRTLRLLKSIVSSDKIDLIDSMFDVTNGGLRGDLNEISKTAGVGFIVEYDRIIDLIDPSIRMMLEKHQIDPLGVSLDSIVMAVRREHADEIIEFGRSIGVRIEVIGESIREKNVLIRSGGEVRRMETKYRESAYTKIKKFIGEEAPPDLESILSRVKKISEEIMSLRDKLYEYATMNTSSSYR